ncbi:MAG: hypothetical protein ACI4VM_09190 [Anaerovoracaceae bacterium]
MENSGFSVIRKTDAIVNLSSRHKSASGFQKKWRNGGFGEIPSPKGGLCSIIVGGGRSRRITEKDR